MFSKIEEKIRFIFLKLEAKHDTGRGIQHDITWCQETNRKKVEGNKIKQRQRKRGGGEKGDK